MSLLREKICVIWCKKLCLLSLQKLELKSKTWVYLPLPISSAFFFVQSLVFGILFLWSFTEMGNYSLACWYPCAPGPSSCPSPPTSRDVQGFLVVYAKVKQPYCEELPQQTCLLFLFVSSRQVASKTIHHTCSNCSVVYMGLLNYF